MFNMYVLYFIIGGVLTALLYHCSLKKDNLLTSLIVSIPIFFIIGYILLTINNDKSENYTINTSLLWFISSIILLLIYFFIIYTNNKILSLIIGMILYFIILYLIFTNNILIK